MSQFKILVFSFLSYCYFKVVFRTIQVTGFLNGQHKVVQPFPFLYQNVVIEILLCIDGRNFEVHAVNGGEDVGGALHDALAGLGHRDGRAPRQEDRLVAGTEGKHARKSTLDQNNLN